MPAKVDSGSSTSESWTIAKVLAWATQDLKQRGRQSPRLDAELMLGQVLKCDRIKLIVDSQRPLDKQELGAYRALHQRRRLGEPVAYLRGKREFYGRDFVVDSRVLIPRPETENLVETALRRTRQRSLSARVLDICTGSGCIAITLKCERPTNEVLASDISADALEVARHNSIRLGAQIGLVVSDLFDGLSAYRGHFDLICANPPYVDSEAMGRLAVDIRDFEPHLALASGPDALSVTRRIVTGAITMLAPEGILVLETMAGWAPQVAQLMRDQGLSEIEIEKDYGDHERVISGCWQPSSAAEQGDQAG